MGIVRDGVGGERGCGTSMMAEVDGKSTDVNDEKGEVCSSVSGFVVGKDWGNCS